ncbi:MAG: hypothetical protein ACI8P0_001306 [Planctomycetaceae bacterium]|jgi:hypothetical protein
MLDSFEQLRSAVQCLGVNPSPDVSGASTGFGQDFAALWTGHECGFLTAVRAALEESNSESLQKLEPLLTSLTATFQVEATVASDWLRQSSATAKNKTSWLVTADLCQQWWATLAEQLAAQGRPPEYWKPLLLGHEVPRSGEVSEWELVQIALLAAGFSFAADAARLLVTWNNPGLHRSDLPDGFALAATQAMRCLTVAAPWGDLVPTSIDPIQHPLPKDDTSANLRKHRSLVAMRVLIQDGIHAPVKERLDGVTIPAWLSVRRLIGWLLGDTESLAAPPDRKATGRKSPRASSDQESVAILLVDGGNLPHHGRLRIDEHSELLSGSYLDPIQTGLLLQDGDFVESLAVADEIAGGARTERISSDHNGPSREPGVGNVVSQRLMLTLPSQFHRIDGASAGGLLGMSLYAVARGESLNPRISGSFCLRRKTRTAASPAKRTSCLKK